MNLCHLNFYSDSLGGASSVNVLLPSASAEELAEKGALEVYSAKKEYPCLTLLHGMQGDGNNWLRLTKLEQYASTYGVAVILPSLANSFGMNLPCHMHYDTYISEELPAFLRSILPLSADPVQNYIAGLSMGGFIALHSAFRYPHRFAGAASFSGALEPYDLARMKGPDAAGASLVPRNLLRDLAKAASAAGSALPALYLSCGLQDESILPMNRDMREYLVELGIPHTYEEWNGGHDWNFWDESLQRAFDFLAPNSQGIPAPEAP